jgi:hypothetical protein
LKKLTTIEVGTEIQIEHVSVKVLAIKLTAEGRLLGDQWKPYLTVERTDMQTGQVTKLSLALTELLYYIERSDE